MKMRKIEICELMNKKKNKNWMTTKFKVEFSYELYVMNIYYLNYYLFLLISYYFILR